uniref:Uncharacterized protein n=1 Tax=Setaria digitata TaxID=48799 RepID=A0A915Q000_9BILA
MIIKVTETTSQVEPPQPVMKEDSFPGPVIRPPYVRCFFNRPRRPFSAFGEGTWVRCGGGVGSGSGRVGAGRVGECEARIDGGAIDELLIVTLGARVMGSDWEFPGGLASEMLVTAELCEGAQLRTLSSQLFICFPVERNPRSAGGLLVTDEQDTFLYILTLNIQGAFLDVLVWDALISGCVFTEMPPVSDVDEIIETEVCNRLIRLSCAKMVNAKSERGGAKLHRNLLILHLLRRARDEQKRFPMFTNDPEWTKEPKLAESSMMLHASNEIPASDTYSTSRYVDIGLEDDESGMNDGDDENEDESATHLLDLSKNHEPMHLDNGCDSLGKQEQIEFDYSTLRLAPLHYTFTNPEMYGVDETISAQQHIYSESSSLPDIYFSEEMISSHPVVGQQIKEKEGEDLEELGMQESKQHSGFDYFAVSAGPVVAPVSDSTSDEEEVGSCSSDSEDEESGDSGNGSLCPTFPPHRRKRKTSALHLPSSCSIKKCCVEERQLTGLISVFNSGLSVVADQFLARPPSSTVSALQQTPKQINSFIHITCNPLIC